MIIYLLFIQCFITNSLNQIIIRDSGIAQVADDDIAILLYITLENISKEDYNLDIRMLDCLEVNFSENVTNSVYMMGGYAGTLYSKYVRNFTVIYPNMYFANKQGQCTVSIRYENEQKAGQISDSIEYSTGQCPTKICDNAKCRSPDLDPLQDCIPIDCMMKYSGEKNYFNKSIMLCQSVPLCSANMEIPETMYSFLSNTCKNINECVDKADLLALENNKAVSCNCNFMANTVCHHGMYHNETGECECLTDWVTSAFSDDNYEPSLQQYHICNVEVNAWNYVNGGKVKTTIILICIFAITIASKIVILMCILTWCIKWARYPFRKMKRKPDAELTSTEKSAIGCMCQEESFIVPDEATDHAYKKESRNRIYKPVKMISSEKIEYSTSLSNSILIHEEEYVTETKKISNYDAFPSDNEKMPSCFYDPNMCTGDIDDCYCDRSNKTISADLKKSGFKDVSEDANLCECDPNLCTGEILDCKCDHSAGLPLKKLNKECDKSICDKTDSCNRCCQQVSTADLNVNFFTESENKSIVSKSVPKSKESKKNSSTSTIVTFESNRNTNESDYDEDDEDDEDDYEIEFSERSSSEDDEVSSLEQIDEVDEEDNKTDAASK